MPRLTRQMLTREMLTPEGAVAMPTLTLLGPTTNSCSRRSRAAPAAMAAAALGEAAVAVREQLAQGDVVQRAAQRALVLADKKQMRPAASINGLLPPGAGSLKTTVPRRKDYGPVGELGDAAHAAAMEEFSVTELSKSHVQHRTQQRQMGMVSIACGLVWQ